MHRHTHQVPSALPLFPKLFTRAGLAVVVSCIVASSPASARIPSARVKSISVLKGLIRVRAQPRIHSKVVGKIVASGRFAVFAVRPAGHGCATRWYQIGPRRWVCSGWLQAHEEPPTRIDDQVALFRQGPWRINRSRRIPFYPSLRRLGASNPRWLRILAGFQIRSQRFVGRRAFLHTSTGGWVALSDTKPAPVSSLTGIDIPEGTRVFPFAFVVTNSAPVWKEDHGGIKPTGEDLSSYQAVRVREKVVTDAQCYLRLLSGKLIRCNDARMADVPPPPPKGIGPAEHWLDLDGANKILYARKGRDVVRVMLVSLGRTTPSGIFIVKEKWLSLTLNMRYGKSPYFLENVPFVIFFWKGFALHEAYWHNGFGVTESHGCVNLSPQDARWVFRFVKPSLPPGFVWLKTTDPENASYVRVRGTGRRVHTVWEKQLLRRFKAQNGTGNETISPSSPRPAS